MSTKRIKYEIQEYSNAKWIFIDLSFPTQEEAEAHCERFLAHGIFRVCQVQEMSRFNKGKKQ